MSYILTNEDFKNIRLVLGLTQVELQQEFAKYNGGKGISRPTISNIEKKLITRIKPVYFDILKLIVIQKGKHVNNIPQVIYSNTHEFLYRFLVLHNLHIGSHRNCSKNVTVTVKNSIKLVEDFVNILTSSGGNRYSSILSLFDGSINFTRTKSDQHYIRRYSNGDLVAEYSSQLIIKSGGTNLICFYAKNTGVIPSWAVDQLTILGEKFEVLLINPETKESRIFSEEDVTYILKRNTAYIKEKFSIS